MSDQLKRANYYTFMAKLGYGLAGAGFLTITQFISDSRVPTREMAILVGSVPLMLVAAMLIDLAHAGEQHPFGSAASWIVVFLSIVAGCSIYAIGETFAAVRPGFDKVLFDSSIAALITLFVLGSRIR